MTKFRVRKVQRRADAQGEPPAQPLDQRLQRADAEAGEVVFQQVPADRA